METTKSGELLNKKQRDFLMDLLSDQEEVGIIIDSQLDIAIKNKFKSDELSGFPNTIYQKLNVKNAKERQIQSLIHIHLWMKAIDELYHYIDRRGEQLKKKIQDHIDLFIETP